MTEPDSKLSRRKVFAGAGAVGALAAVAAAVPMVKAKDYTAAQTRLASNEQEAAYQLTEHVKQYYRTARV